MKLALSLSLGLLASCSSLHGQSQVAGDDDPLAATPMVCNATSEAACKASTLGQPVALEDGLMYRALCLGDGPFIDPKTGESVMVQSFSFEMWGPAGEVWREATIQSAPFDSSEPMTMQFGGVSLAVGLGPEWAAEPTRSYVVTFAPAAGKTWSTGGVECHVERAE